MVSLLLNYFSPIYTALFSNITYVANIRAKIMLR